MRLRVLVVDDNRETAKCLASLLRRFGHDVRVAFNGPTALREASETEPDVVLLDLGIPGMDSFEVARRMKDQLQPKKPFFVAVTGFTLNGDFRRSVEEGMDFHLVKPIEPELLLMVLEGLGGERPPRQNSAER